jgi:thioester reductase-like protein/non-ribosomal peptide synthase protein (TIGR01720 family)
VSRGYTARPGLTAERFLPDPFLPGGRLYRTGDRCRLGEDGALEYLGRADGQLKVRGYRIEPGEIEATLLSHAAVDGCVVAAVPRSGGGSSLAAWYVGEGRPESVRAHLRAVLPEHMVPPFLVSVPSLPLLPNGKVNRTALPSPQPPTAGSAAYVPPGEPAEELLCAIWSAALGVERVGLNDDFFELGGDSLLAIRAVSMISDATGLDVPVRALFDGPTVAAFRSRLDRGFDLEPGVLAEDLVLPSDITPPPSAATGHRPRGVLLTGATGFLGVFVLSELLLTTKHEVTCLVRAGTDEEARARLVGRLEAWGLRPPLDRLVVVAGDVEAPLLGLHECRWRDLARDCGYVLHAAAHVNHLLGYRSLREANVRSLVRVLRFAVRGAPSRVCFVSTLSAGAYPVDSDPSVLSAAGGYVQSKWAAERLASEARARGIEVVVCRPALILGDTVMGRLPRDRYWFSQFLLAAVHTGVLPDVAVLPTSGIPVDLAGRSIVDHLLRRGEPEVLELHGGGPIAMNAIEAALDLRGQPTRREPLDDWLLRVSSAARSRPGLQLARLPFDAALAAGAQFDESAPPGPPSSARGASPTVDVLARIVAFLGGTRTGSFPLTPVQRWWWDLDLPERKHWNQALLLEVMEAIDPAALTAALDALVRRHPMLRVRWTVTDGAVEQHVAPVGDWPLRFENLSALGSDDRAAAMWRIGVEAHGSLDLRRGPIGRAVAFDRGPSEPSALLLVVHHWAVDVVSWRIIVEDLEALYLAGRAGRRPDLPAPTATFADWSRRLREYAGGATLAAELPYWVAIADRSTTPLPVDHDLGAELVATSDELSRWLSAKETRALLGPRAAAPGEPSLASDVLITALGVALCGWTDGGTVVVDVEAHGREDLFDDLDVSRTVGWFTAVFPVVLDLGACPAPWSALDAVREQLGAVPCRGIGYGVLRYLDDGASTRPLRTGARAEVLFNYLGTLRTSPDERRLRRASIQQTGQGHSPVGRRPYPIEVVAAVADGRLVTTWRYGTTRHRRSTIERIADSYCRLLQTFARGSLEPGEAPP